MKETTAINIKMCESISEEEVFTYLYRGALWWVLPTAGN